MGQSGHKFTPGETKAKVGDTIEFKFYPVAHWVIRGDFDYPCIPYEYVGTDRRGFSSGEEPVQAITDDVSETPLYSSNSDPDHHPGTEIPSSCQRHRANLLLLRCTGIMCEVPHDGSRESGKLFISG
jgi:hypothetical protein